MSSKLEYTAIVEKSPVRKKKKNIGNCKELKRTKEGYVVPLLLRQCDEW